MKDVPEDFTVEEIIKDRLEESWKEKTRLIYGKKPAPPAQADKKYLWFTLKKTGMDFFQCLNLLSERLNISTKSIGYAGTKDRKAVTYQTISVPASKESELKKLKIRDVEFRDFRYRKRPVKLGEHEGNRFQITLRNMEKAEVRRARNGLLAIRKEGLVNFFGKQRFGFYEKNHVVGRLLVKGELENSLHELFEIYKRGGKAGSMKSYSYVMVSRRHLKKHPGDYEGAIRKIPLRLLKLFVHAYQSHIWNEAAKILSKKNGTRRPNERGAGRKNMVIPVPGYETPIHKYPGSGPAIKGILSGEGVLLGDFKNRKMPELSSKGTERDFLVFPGELKSVVRSDEKNKGKDKVVLTFTLPKGSYATELVEQVMKERGAFGKF